MESPKRNPKHGYHSPNNNQPFSAAKILRPVRNPRFAYNVAPRSTNLKDHRKRLLQNAANNPTNTTKTNSARHLNKYKFCIIASIIFFSMIIVVGIPIILLIALGPRVPTLTVEQVSFYYPIFYESPTRFASLFNITMKVTNPARHISFVFEGDNSIIVASYSGIRLSSGVFPSFFQEPKEEITLQTPMTGIGLVLPDDVKKKLESDHEKRMVPLTLSVMGRVKYEMGFIKLRAMLRVSCEVVLDNLVTYTTNIVSSNCDSAAGFWLPYIRT
ncbi:hypothetical protein COLO4_16641 [Corchorus olitorius]|uniref:Late embryogenesis abundant protein, LEA-14 n=1 Tax=Corchorus olitorius TaxID=93759 RepID=A0A1R3JG98_9ROSI|nr:hypothetical protein COLO4_16641 [Corchorus olitorius]